MSSELDLKWLNEDAKKGAVLRFTEFCKEDIKQQSSLEGFDINRYQEAIKLVIGKLDDSVSVEDLFNAD